MVKAFAFTFSPSDYVQNSYLVLDIPYDYVIDIWSVAGNLYKGRDCSYMDKKNPYKTNNYMLQVFMGK